MEETLERQYISQLNKDRGQDSNNDLKNDSADAAPNTAEYLIFLGIAIIVDALGVLADLTIILAIPIRVLVLPMVGVLTLWRALKRKKSGAAQWIMLGGSTILESITSFLPTWTIFVLSMWIMDTKLAKNILKKAPKLIKATK